MTTRSTEISGTRHVNVSAKLDSVHQMQINDIIWMNHVVEKIQRKHKVSPGEVEEVFYNRPKYRRAEKGKFEGEDLYYAYGRTDSGRHLLVIFIYKKTKDALVMSARDMDSKERGRYAKK